MTKTAQYRINPLEKDKAFWFLIIYLVFLIFPIRLKLVLHPLFLTIYFAGLTYIIWFVLYKVTYSLILLREGKLIEQRFLGILRRELLVEDISEITVAQFGPSFPLFVILILKFWKRGPYGPLLVNNKYKKFPSEMVSPSLIEDIKAINQNMPVVDKDNVKLMLLQWAAVPKIRIFITVSLSLVMLFVFFFLLLYPITP